MRNRQQSRRELEQEGGGDEHAVRGAETERLAAGSANDSELVEAIQTERNMPRLVMLAKLSMSKASIHGAKLPTTRHEKVMSDCD